ncbi:MAG: nitrogen regulation protein NR(II) [Syntrophales bacterium]
METFALAAISLIIAVSLVIRKKKNLVLLSFSVVCFALFFQKAGAFLADIFTGGFWIFLHYMGALAISPLIVAFTRYLLNSRDFVPGRAVVFSALGSLLIAVAFITPLSRHVPLLEKAPYLYSAFTLLYCNTALFFFVRKSTRDEDRKRMMYVLIACIAAAAISLSDLLAYYGFGFPRLSDMAIAALLYFVLIVVSHSELPELYEIMARAFLTFILILFATFIFLVIIGLFWKGPVPSLATILVASLIIIVAIDPVKMIIKKIFDYLFPENKEIFASLYGFDRELEREKSMFLEEMATGLAHEIRNPLGSIKGAAQYLREEEDISENRRLLNVIIEEVDRLNSTVSQFLNYAKPYTLNLKKQDINQIIGKAVSLIETNKLSDSIIIEQDLHPGLPPVLVDAEQMLQVILNIAINAIDAMPDGGTLSFRTSRIESDAGEGEAIGITIRDTGKGIRSEDIKNIFKPFFTTKDRGVGLGLSICQKIIKRHGGHIRVKSIPDQGSIFLIRIGIAG